MVKTRSKRKRVTFLLPEDRDPLMPKLIPEGENAVYDSEDDMFFPIHKDAKMPVLELVEAKAVVHKDATSGAIPQKNLKGAATGKKGAATASNLPSLVGIGIGDGCGLTEGSGSGPKEADRTKTAKRWWARSGSSTILKELVANRRNSPMQILPCLPPTEEEDLKKKATEAYAIEPVHHVDVEDSKINAAAASQGFEQVPPQTGALVGDDELSNDKRGLSPLDPNSALEAELKNRKSASVKIELRIPKCLKVNFLQKRIYSTESTDLSEKNDESKRSRKNPAEEAHQEQDQGKGMTASDRKERGAEAVIHDQAKHNDKDNISAKDKESEAEAEKFDQKISSKAKVVEAETEKVGKEKENQKISSKAKVVEAETEKVGKEKENQKISPKGKESEVTSQSAEVTSSTPEKTPGQVIEIIELEEDDIEPASDEVKILRLVKKAPAGCKIVDLTD